MKCIIERKRSAITVVTASTRWAPSTAAELADFLGPELADGETMPDLELLQKLFGRALERRWRLLETADQAHVSAAARRRRTLTARGAAVKKLYRGVVDLRTLMRGVFGAAPARRLLGLGGKTSSDPAVLLRQAGRTMDRLRDASRRTGSTPQVSPLEASAAPVATLARTLKTAHARASVAGKQLEAAAAERRRAAGDFNAALARVGGWLASTYRAAGRDQRAEAVRPSGRCPGLLLKDERRRPSATARPESTRQSAAVEQESRPTIDREMPPIETGEGVDDGSRSSATLWQHASTG